MKIIKLAQLAQGIRNLFIILLFLILTNAGFSQTISGVINSYLRVTAVNNGTLTFTCDNLSGSIADFAAGKTVMIYQAKGATITTTNTSSYGDITAYNNAGNYEFQVISSISGSSPYTIIVTSLASNYTATDLVQLISVPRYTSVTATATVTATPWSATQGRGGVVALEVTNTLTLAADIDVSSQGFAGGLAGGNNGGCSDNTTYVTTDANYGQKGEGISDFVSGNQYARGAQANGGGGGNPHNGGGGGGANYTQAGGGGQGWTGACGFVPSGGIAGNKVTGADKIFLGGGGGSGQQNNNVASSGGNGGGIIVLRANTVTSSCGGTYNIIANGQTANGTTGNDGAGGGGAGGTIVLDVINYNLPTCAINVSSNGGNGGLVNDGTTHGGGGGGGIGVVFEVSPTSNTNVSIASTAGSNGLDCTSCGAPTGSTPETPTTSKSTITAVPGTIIPLPIELMFFTGYANEEGVSLSWATASETNNDYFTVERSTNEFNFTAIAKVKANGNSLQKQTYNFYDHEVSSGKYYYKLKQTDYDGKFTYSKIIFVETHTAFELLSIYPNPASENVNVVYSGEGNYTIKLINNKGITVCEQTSSYNQILNINTLNFPKGLYIVEIITKSKRHYNKLIIE